MNDIASLFTLQWCIASFHKLAIVHICQEAASACCPQQNFRNSKLLGSFQSKAHDPIRNNTCYWWHPECKRVIECGYEVAQRSKTVDRSILTQGWSILSCIRVRNGQAVWDRVKPEVRKAIKGVRTPGSDQAIAVKVCVDKSNMKAFVMKKFGQFQHWIYVTL